MKVSACARIRTPPSRVNAGLARRRVQQRRCRSRSVPAKAAAQPEKQGAGQRRRRQIGSGHRGLVWPQIPHAGIEEVNAGRLLIPGVLVGLLPGEDPLADVRVEPLVAAGRLGQRGHTDGEQRRERERDEGGAAQEWRSGPWVIQNHSTTRPSTLAPTT